VANWKGHQKGPKPGFAAGGLFEPRLPGAKFPLSIDGRARVSAIGYSAGSHSPHSDRPAMTDDRDKIERQAAPAKDSRQNRLKLALRENLKRRKSQARARSEPASASSENGDASLDDAGGRNRPDR
jgi:hypothetical protein